MSHLRPCTGCSRHVRAGEARCPFCDAALAVAHAAPTPPNLRLSRAARMAFGAAVATGATIAGCASGTGPVGGDAGIKADSASPLDAGPDVVAPPFDSGGPAKPYGAPPADGLMPARRIV